jgi:hypothetical protein
LAIFSDFLQKNYEGKQFFIEKKHVEANNHSQVVVEEETSRITGGSCWDEGDEDNTYYESISDHTIEHGIRFGFKCTLRELIKSLDLSVDDFDKWLDNNRPFSRIGEYTRGEYYGNSTTYGLYALPLDTVVEKFCTTVQKEAYKKSLSDFVPVESKKNKYSW